MKISEALKAAKAKIERPETWTTLALARATNGNKTGPRAPGAKCWCAIGALRAVVTEVRWDINGARWTGEEDEARGYLDFAAGMGIEELNDVFGHEAVMFAYNRAIALAEEAGE